MFAVIYKFYIKSGRELEYTEAWHQVAHYFMQQRGALGSSLHRTSEGLWVAYSRWPDQKTRDASWPGEDAPSHNLPSEICKEILILKECVDQKLPDIYMEVIDDLLLSRPGKR